ncbi:DVUA0089 family protein [Diaphorobacter sp.]|uniref:DVUA0089 family protein n=1 Tax=Diaphorobacter sp. TaxID=1934310 RepID=UPI003D106620
MTQFSRFALAAALGMAGFAAHALPVASVGAGSAATAQVLDASLFSTNFVATVTNSTTQPHVEVTRSGLQTAYDFYTFGTSGGSVTIDFDSINQTDMEVGLWNAAGLLLAANDDYSYDGSFILDAAILNFNVAAGDYFIGVCRFSCSFGNNFAVSGSALGSNGAYVMNVSANQNQVPEPGTMGLMGLALAGLGVAARRSKVR